MKNKKLKLIYSIFSVIILLFTIIIFILGRMEIINGNIGYITVLLLIALWIFTSAIIRNKNESSLPVIQTEAILTEKNSR